VSTAIITGSAGLIGSEAAAFLHEKGMSIVGIDNDLRSYFFGIEASTAWKAEELKAKLRHYKHRSIDIRSGEVYNMGGSRHNSCSVLEAIGLIEKISGRCIRFSISDQARMGDHIWWISNVSRFQRHYPDWNYAYDLRKMIEEIVDGASHRIRKTVRGA